ncbi:stage V sporulation protein AA [Fontibacillus panacisegetis]|uniref:Stage V sporulation protein AA n=1 Tax=Fontibacillus panacisegetis TaxID=670482 RepID=A0A1G7SIF9_9BACL|nr:stage V sporulation protein AA [Fontibacillus panacisegetis]SDG22209.1 stage V sporulation protein AA [Fontibacillus panacisegetis]
MEKKSASYVYLRLCKQVAIPLGSLIRLKDIAHVLAEPQIEHKLLDIVMDRPECSDGNLIVIDMLQVIAKIKELFPDVQVEIIGEAHVLVEMIAEKKKPSVILFIAVWLLLFFGAALTIMNFHADVSMPAVQIRIVEMITGEKDEHPYLFQAAYSIGIGLGMIVFFNHLFKKKWNEEPTPLEVEMYLYQENLNQYVIAEEFKKQREAERNSKGNTS